MGALLDVSIVKNTLFSKAFNGTVGLHYSKIVSHLGDKHENLFELLSFELLNPTRNFA